MKIQHLIDTLLSPTIKALDWVDRYGGLVRTIHYQIGGQEKGGPVKRFPVACDVQDQDCNNLSVLQDLMPDDRKDSIVYWEELSPMTDRGRAKGRSQQTRMYEGTARLVVWMNLKRLGQTSCTTPIEAVAQLEAIITQQLKLGSSEIFANAVVTIRPVKQVKKDINTIFGKYDYDKLVPYYLPPFDYFAIDVTFKMTYCLKTGGTLVVADPIDCVNEIPGVPVDACEALLATITPEMLCSCVIPSLDFSIGDDTDWGCLSDDQKDDLTTRLCATLAIHKIVLSTRLVVLTYTGDCMIVERDSDNAQLSIPFVASGDYFVIDEAAIATFCGTALGFVTSWLDQSPNGVNATQGTITAMPQIYDGANVIKVNGYPSVWFNNAFSLPTKTLSLRYAVAVDLKTDVMMYVSKAITQMPVNASFYVGGGVGSSALGFGTRPVSLNEDQNSKSVHTPRAQTIESGKLTFFDYKLNSFNLLTIRRNGTDVVTYSRQNSQPNPFLVMLLGAAPSNNGVKADMFMSELVLLDTSAATDPVTTQADRETEIVSYYSL